MTEQLIPNTRFTRFALAVWRANLLNGTLRKRPSGRYADRKITRMISKAIIDAKGNAKFEAGEFERLFRKALYIMEDHLRWSWGAKNPFGITTIDDLCANAIAGLNMNIAGWFKRETAIGD